MFFLTVSTASTYACSMFLPNSDVAANGLEHLSDKYIIDDNANYIDKDFRLLLPTSNLIDGTN